MLFRSTAKGSLFEGAGTAGAVTEGVKPVSYTHLQVGAAGSGQQLFAHGLGEKAQTEDAAHRKILDALLRNSRITGLCIDPLYNVLPSVHTRNTLDPASVKPFSLTGLSPCIATLPKVFS